MEVGGQLAGPYSVLGDGPIDATYKAITHLAGSKCTLLKFAVSSITGGTDAHSISLIARLRAFFFTIIGVLLVFWIL